MDNPLILVFLVAFSRYSSIQAITYLKENNIFDEYYEKCAPSVTCDKTYKYRTMDGTCNNLEHTSWGSTNTPYNRLGPAYYNDDNYTLRVQHKDGKELPGARKLQLELFWPRIPLVDVPDIRNYHANQVGQFITHDISFMPSNFRAPPADCCAVQNDDNIPYVCQAVIMIDPLDPSYSEINKTCISFRRAMTASFDFNCEITPQIPVNQQTAFIDASQVYGPTDAKADSLRSHDSGKLKTEIINGQEFGVQQQRHGSKFCGGRNNVNICFNRGDPRNNQHFGLVLYEEAFLRFHNLIAKSLKDVNKKWSDETLYQEARRFVIGVIQIMVYRDYLPILLGSDYCESVGLALNKNDPTVYDPSVMPQLAVEFPGGCFRVPHNVVPSIYYFLDEYSNVLEQFKLNEFMGDPTTLVGDSKLAELCRGMSFLPGRFPLSTYNKLISSRMFHDWVSTVADEDLLSIDIQRGRDIGLPPYTKVREICGFPKIESFSDLTGIIKESRILLLQKHYVCVEDIDLVVGALLEPLVDGAMVGETAMCIIADGFLRTRYGDRFFVDVKDQPGSFSEEQLDVLWSIDLAQIFCATIGIDQLPRDIFTPNGFSGTYDCDSINWDLEAWKEN